jgi:hypothetical protein
MPMTRKDYQAVADVLRAERENWEGNGSVLNALAYVASGLAGAFAASNQAFDRKKFLEAARVPTNGDGSIQ